MSVELAAVILGGCKEEEYLREFSVFSKLLGCRVRLEVELTVVVLGECKEES
jgi:hypothetical protein